MVRGLDGTRLVVEVTEHAAVEDYEQLTQAIDQFRSCGVRLAIDDAGAGYSSLQHVVRLMPEFIKLDMFLTRDIDSDPVKRALASALVTFAAEMGARRVGGIAVIDDQEGTSDIGHPVTHMR